jgi:hypothetical protein
MIVSATATAQTGTKFLVAVRVLIFIGTVSLREATRACQM